MLHHDGNSDPQSGIESGIESVRPAGRGISHNRLLIPGLGLTLALVAVVCFADDLRSTNPAASAPAAASNSTAPVAMIPAKVGRTAIPRVAGENAVPASIRHLLRRLDAGNDYLTDTKWYAATFTQQVYKDGELLDPEQIRIKVQHQPFSVFLEWVRDGQQALYVQGQHDNKLLVHPTRGFGRLRRVWILDPENSLAMRGARRPITEIGLLNLVELLRGFHREHILASHCAEHPRDSDRSSTTRYTLTFDGPHQNPYFAKTVLWLCDDRHIPLRIENYAWTDDHHIGPLLESYEYTDICVDGCVVEADFDRENKAYKF